MVKVCEVIASLKIIIESVSLMFLEIMEIISENCFFFGTLVNFYGSSFLKRLVIRILIKY